MENLTFGTSVEMTADIIAEESLKREAAGEKMVEIGEARLNPLNDAGEISEGEFEDYYRPWDRANADASLMQRHRILDRSETLKKEAGNKRRGQWFEEEEMGSASEPEYDADGRLNDWQVLSEKRVLNRATTMREVVDQLSKFKVVFANMERDGKVSPNEIALHQEFTKFMTERDGYKGDATKLLNRVKLYLMEHMEASMFELEDKKSDADLYKENIDLDKEKTLRDAMQQIRQARQEMGLDGQQDLAWLTILTDEHF